MSFASNDFIADDSEIIPAEVNADQSRWLKKLNANTITFIMDNGDEEETPANLDYSFASITLKITKETTFVLSGESAYKNYTLHQVDSATQQQCAKDLPSLYAQNIIKR